METQFFIILSKPIPKSQPEFSFSEQFWAWNLFIKQIIIKIIFSLGWLNSLLKITWRQKFSLLYKQLHYSVTQENQGELPKENNFWNFEKFTSMQLLNSLHKLLLWQNYFLKNTKTNRYLWWWANQVTLRLDQYSWIMHFSVLIYIKPSRRCLLKINIIE